MNNEQDFIGLSKKESQNLAEKRNLIYRLIRIDEKQFQFYPLSNDIRDDRICIEIDDHQVTKAIIS